MFKLPVKVLLLSVALLFSHQAWSSIGTIVLATGEVEIQRANKVIAAKTGSTLLEQDKVVTRQNARAQLRFSDDTVITLGSQTEFAIDAFLNEGANKSVAKFNIAKGTFKAISGTVGKVAPEKFTLKTRTATIGIRGTIFTGRITADEEFIATLNGLISVTEDQTGISVNVPAGQMTQVLPGQAPQPPKPFSAQDLDAMSASSSDDESTDQADDSQDVADTSTDEAADQSELAVLSSVDQALNTQIEQNVADQAQAGIGNMLNSFSGYPVFCSEFGPCVPHQGGRELDALSDVPGLVVTQIDKHVGWGTWAGEYDRGYWIGGNYVTEAAQHIAGLLDYKPTQGYTYNGGLMGEVTINDNNNTREKILTSQLNLIFNFAEVGAVSGSAEFTTASTVWNVAMSGVGFDGEQFGLSGAVSVTPVNGDPIYGQGENSMNGHFFGPNAESVGGDFNFDAYGSTSYSASGVFKATR